MLSVFFLCLVEVKKIGFSFNLTVNVYLISNTQIFLKPHKHTLLYYYPARLALAYRVSLGSIALTRRQWIGRVKPGQRTLVVVSFEWSMRESGRLWNVWIAGRRGGMWVERRRRGRGSAGIRRKTGRRWRRGYGQATVPGSGATISGCGIWRNGGRVGRSA